MVIIAGYHQLSTINGIGFNTKNVSICDEDRQQDITYNVFRKIVVSGEFRCLLDNNNVVFKVNRTSEEKRLSVLTDANKVSFLNRNDNVYFVDENTFTQILLDVYCDFIVDFCKNTRSYEKVNSKTINYKFLTKIIVAFFTITFLLLANSFTCSFVINCIIFYNIFIFAVKCIFTCTGIILDIKKHVFVRRNCASNVDASISFEKLPVYTILVPMFRENKTTVMQMIDALNNLNYPKNKLDVKFVLEENDEHTLAILNSIKNDNCHEIIIPDYINEVFVPFFLPQTKPKACNVASLFALGEYLVIFDAEDIPDPNQLIDSFQIFNCSSNIFCIQCNLIFYNHSKNLITSFFNIEYNVHFKVLLNAYSYFKIMLPLGGTSNHFKFHGLEKYKFWDSYNVTEDVEISSILFCDTDVVKYLDSDTREWCVESIKSWIKQRTRWMKGYLLTYYLCIYRNKRKTSDNLFHTINLKNLLFNAIRRFIFKHIIVGSQVVVFLLLPFVLISLLCGNVYFIFYKILLLISILNYILCVLWYLCLIKREDLKLNKFTMLSCIFYPFYFILHIIASYIALIDLVRRPFYWAKTEHKC